jgi:putative oxidoreductase
MKESSANWHDLGLLFLRVMAGAGMAYHGYQKVFGGQMQMLTPGVAQMGFPMPEFFAWAAALSEFVGGICLALGLFTRFAALFIFITMSVAVFIALKGKPLDGRELALAYWTISGALIFLGGGSFSVGNLIKK